PSVSVPNAAAAHPAATELALPVLEPDGSDPLIFGHPRTYGDCASPPPADQPFVLPSRFMAHSDMFVFPSIIAPARRSWATTAASDFGPPASSGRRAKEPAVVFMPRDGCVAMLSFRTIGIFSGTISNEAPLFICRENLHREGVLGLFHFYALYP